MMCNSSEGRLINYYSLATYWYQFKRYQKIDTRHMQGACAAAVLFLAFGEVAADVADDGLYLCIGAEAGGEHGGVPELAAHGDGASEAACEDFRQTGGLCGELF